MRATVIALTVMAPCLWGTPGFAQDSGSVADIYRQSYAAESKGDYAKALSLMKRISALGPKDYVLHLRSGWVQYLNGEYAESVEEYRKAEKMQPAAIEPRLGVMLPLMAARRWKEAVEAGLAVLEKAPADFTAQSRIAYVCYQQGQFLKAEKWYRKALDGFPSNVEMRAGLGWSLLKQNRFREAKLEFDSVLIVAPDHASAQEGLSQIP